MATVAKGRRGIVTQHSPSGKGQQVCVEEIGESFLISRWCGVDVSLLRLRNPKNLVLGFLLSSQADRGRKVWKRKWVLWPPSGTPPVSQEPSHPPFLFPLNFLPLTSVSLRTQSLTSGNMNLVCVCRSNYPYIKMEQKSTSTDTGNEGFLCLGDS